MSLSIIVGMAKNRVIGVDNDLPWHIPADLKYFQATTLGKPILMGRKTFDSIGKPLPGRQNIVITRNDAWKHEGVTVCPSLEAAISSAGEADEVMIVGGAQIYRQAVSMVDRMYITEVDVEVQGDATFPEFDVSEWRETSRQSFSAEDDKPAYAFVVYDRL